MDCHGRHSPPSYYLSAGGVGATSVMMVLAVEVGLVVMVVVAAAFHLSQSRMDRQLNRAVVSGRQ